MKDGEQKMWLNDSLIGSSSYSLSGVDTSHPKYIYMFVSQYVDGINALFNGKSKEVKWYFNNSLVRDFVPCIRNSDNKPGMYDRVNNVFYTNQGSGEFLYGPLKSVPQTYQQVEYIESTGTQWIYTPFIQTQNHIYQEYYDIQFTTLETNQLLGYNAGALLGIINNYYTLGDSVNITTASTSRFQGIVQTNTNNGFAAQGTIDQYSATRIRNNFSQSRTFCIGNLTAQESIYACKAKYYLIKLYADSMKIAEFIPCYRKSDNVIGMLDLVNNVFYTNAGSGTFVKGNNVSNNNYIKYTPTDSDGYEVHNWN